MASSTLLVLMQLLLLASLASAGHYYGGSLTFSAKGRTHNGTLKVDIRFRGTYDWCLYPSWHCLSGNCGSSVINQRGTIDRSVNGRSAYWNRWCETETVMTTYVSTNRPFQMREASCCWIPLRNRIGGWRLLTQVDLGTRSDTREPNRSPDTAILPLLRVRQNCPRTYNLMAFDPDGDQVLCRYGTTRGTECSSCNQPSGFQLNQGSCTLHYDHTYSLGVYGFELVVEDFPKRSIILAYTDGSQSVRSPLRATTTNSSLITTTSGLYASTAPLSKLPLQFSLLVDSAAPSCRDGDYFPKFMHPTPRDGERLHAEVNKELEIRVKAWATHSTVYDVIISGPLNITKHRTTHDEFVIRWTPVQNDLGDHFAICFVAESATGNSVPSPSPSPSPSYHQHHYATVSLPASDIYQSEMRCVVVAVGRKQIEAHVICEETTMTVEVNKSSFPRLHEDHLQLNDPSNIACSLLTHSNSTHIIAVVPLNACGTQIEEDEENLIFKNVITTVDNINDIITRRHLVDVEFYCQYNKRGNVSLSFSAHRNNVTVEEKGFGTFTYQFEFFHGEHFNTMIDPASYPLEFDVGDKIYMEIDATSSLNNTELFVESCSAAPYDNPNYSPMYPIIENGCKVDPTVDIYSPSHKKFFRFGMEAFKFIGMHDQVYISCSVIVCEAGNPDTRCSRGCDGSASPSGHHHHHLRKRSAVIQTASHFISQGPLRLRKASETTVTNLNMNLVFMAGCLLAAVGMICAVVLYKTNMSRVKYQPLPSCES